MKALLKFFSSLKLTVVLLAFSMVLIFFGTIKQVETGIWETQKVYFESFFLYAEIGPLKIPYFPAGYLIGAFLFVNLLAAHLSRFKLSIKKSGIFLVHFGFILLLVSELLTDILAVESQMIVDEGGTANYSQAFRKNELVLIDRSAPGHDIIHSIPAELLEPGKRVEVPDTELSIETIQYMPNSQVFRPETPLETPATRGAGATMNIAATPKAYDYSDRADNVRSAYIEVLGPEGSMGTWLVSTVIDNRFPPQEVKLGDQKWEIALRFQRYYHPFELELIDFKHDKYPGTEIPFNFSSEVMVRHEDSTKNQKALIYMNHPLRYEGLTFYQASFANEDRTSIFQVVRNPGWLLPYFSVLLMGLGMIVQFGMHFIKFLSKRKA